MFHVVCPVLKKVYHKTVTFMQAKVYRAMQRAQGKMLREYFSGVVVDLSWRGCHVVREWLLFRFRITCQRAAGLDGKHLLG